MKSQRLRFMAVLAVCCGAGCGVPPRTDTAVAPARGDDLAALPLYVVPRADDAFLDELQRRIFQYFWNEIYPETGIAIDHIENRMGKVAATGFSLPAICIGVQRGWVSRDEGYERVLKILNAFWDDPDDPDDPYAEGQFGLYWHFVDGKTGKKVPIDCVAMCDSADFIGGVVVAGEFFSAGGGSASGGKGTPVEALAKKIYDNVQWDQFVLRDKDGKPDFLSFGWVPLHVSENYYDTDGLIFGMGGLADNSLLIYALALGSDTHPIPQATWDKYVDDYVLEEYAGYEAIRTGALFCRQVPHSFIRFSRKRDRRVDYFLDTVNALLADRAFNMRENGYPPELWGLTDCFGKDSYSHGAPPGTVMNDGTVGATAFVGALPHIPDLALEAIRYVMAAFGERVWGRYGLTSSVNLKNGFVSPLYVGIELGPMIMLIENYRSGLIWDLMMNSACMKNFVRKAGMSGVVDDFELPREAPPYAIWTTTGGRSALTSEAPQHGRKCLEIQPDESCVRISGRLTENDLLAFHYNSYLSLWLRDLDPTACSAVLDGRECRLESAGRVPGTGWEHHYFRLPAAGASRLSGVIVEATVTGDEPAVDNLTLEAGADLAAPDAVSGLAAATGVIGESVDLHWTVPADRGGGRVAGFVIQMESGDDVSGVFQVDWAADTDSRQDQRLLLEPGLEYRFAVAARDEHGHVGPASDWVAARANPQRLNRTAYDFENGLTAGWEAANRNWLMEVVENRGPTGATKCLRVEYRKEHPWNYIVINVDSNLVAQHRYITMQVKGDLEILGKLYCSEDAQEDMNRERVRAADGWTLLKFDTLRANLTHSERAGVQRMYLFFEPGIPDRQGVVFIDDVTYADQL